jgi:glycyl-tRNA synthetase alpha subunit
MNLAQKAAKLDEEIEYIEYEFSSYEIELARLNAILRAFREVAREASRKTLLQLVPTNDNVIDRVLAEMESESPFAISREFGLEQKP